MWPWRFLASGAISGAGGHRYRVGETRFPAAPGGRLRVGQVCASCRPVCRLGSVLHGLVPPVVCSLLTLFRCYAFISGTRQGAFAAQPSARLAWPGLYLLADAHRCFELAGFAPRYPVPEPAWDQLFMTRTYQGWVKAALG